MRVFRSLASAQTMLGAEEHAVLRADGKSATVLRDSAGGVVVMGDTAETLGGRYRGDWNEFQTYVPGDRVRRFGQAFAAIATSPRTRVVPTYFGGGGATAYLSNLRIYGAKQWSPFTGALERDDIAGPGHFRLRLWRDPAILVAESAGNVYASTPGSFILPEVGGSGVTVEVDVATVTESDLASNLYYVAEGLWTAIEPGFTTGWETCWEVI